MGRVWLLVVGAALLGAPGCGKGKTAQCDAFVERANATVTSVRVVEQKLDDSRALCKEMPILAGSPEQCDAQDRRSLFLALHDGADKIDQEASALDGVPLSDAKLLTLRASYTTALRTSGSATRDFAKLLDERRKEKPKDADFDAVGARFAQADRAFETLTTDINAYCKAR